MGVGGKEAKGGDVCVFAFIYIYIYICIYIHIGFTLLYSRNQHNIVKQLHSSKKYMWRRQWHPTPVLLPGKSHGRRSLVGYSPWGC